MFKVWNVDAAKWVMGGCKMCKRSAARIADKLEAETRDMHVLVAA